MSDTQISDSARLAHILQLTDSLFPVGGFAYSDGLESAAAGKRVHDASSLAGWLDHFIDAAAGAALWRIRVQPI